MDGAGADGRDGGRRAADNFCSKPIVTGNLSLTESVWLRWWLQFVAKAISNQNERGTSQARPAVRARAPARHD